MRKLNKKKLLIVVGIAIAIIIVIITAIALTNNDEKDEENESNISSDSEFEAMQIKDIDISYSENNNETKLYFVIENLTNKKIEKEKIEIQLIGEKGEIISQIQMTVSGLETQSTQPVPMTVGGDLRGIKTIKLAKP